MQTLFAQGAGSSTAAQPPSPRLPRPRGRRGAAIKAGRSGRERGRVSGAAARGPGHPRPGALTEPHRPGESGGGQRVRRSPRRGRRPHKLVWRPRGPAATGGGKRGGEAGSGPTGRPMEGAPGRGSAGWRERPPGGEGGSEGAGGGGRPVLGEASAAHRQSRRRSRGGGALRGAGGGAARSHPGWQPGAPETGRRGVPRTRGGGQTQGPGPHRRWRRPRPLASVRHARATGRSPDQPRVPGCCRGGPGPALLSSSPRSRC